MPNKTFFAFILPSLIAMVLFIALPLLLRAGWTFVPSLAVSCGLTVAAYFLMLAILKRFGIAI